MLVSDDNACIYLMSVFGAIEQLSHKLPFLSFTAFAFNKLCARSFSFTAFALNKPSSRVALPAKNWMSAIPPALTPAKSPHSRGGRAASLGARQGACGRAAGPRAKNWMSATPPDPTPAVHHRRHRRRQSSARKIRCFGLRLFPPRPGARAKQRCLGLRRPKLILSHEANFPRTRAAARRSDNDTLSELTKSENLNPLDSDTLTSTHTVFNTLHLRYHLL